MSDALRFGAAGFGVKVGIVEPGLNTTNFENAAVASMEGNADGPCPRFNAEVAKATKEVFAGPMRRLGGGPDAVAKGVQKALTARRPLIRYTVTPSASLSIRTRSLMGARGWDAMLKTQCPQPTGSEPRSD